MRAPDFWRREAGLARLLAPLACLYDAGRRLSRAAKRPRHAALPVICAGNFVAGGAGKTPTALALAGLLKAAGRKPHFLTRGYGGRESGPLLIDRDQHGAWDVGDEALLLAAVAPTWIARDRAAGAVEAQLGGADCLVLDDGFQNPGLHLDLGFLVVDAGYGLGNGRLLPAGPLREPVAEAVARADAIVLIESALAPLGSEELPPALGATRLPVLRARLVPILAGGDLRGVRAVAFAGIGRPEKFFETLAAMGVDVAESHGFADHQLYDESRVMRLVDAAAGLEARLLTTAKDFVRLPMAARAMVEVVEVNLEFADARAVAALLDRVMGDG